MESPTSYLITIRQIIKLHEHMLKVVCENYQLTLIEAKVISFLYNNPEKDTAADIVELRMLAKGNVSQAVESLIQKSLLQRKQDAKDRRKMHLSLLPQASPITKAMDAVWRDFHSEIFFGLTQPQREQFEKINEQIMKNVQSAMKRGKML